jgi:hypothetical protein
MSRWEHRYLGQERFPDALSTMEIEHFFSLSEDELAAVRRHGLDRSRYRGDAGMQRWVGLGVIADNLINISRVMAKRPAQ